MHEKGENEGFRAHTNKLELGMGRNLKEKKKFCEKVRFGLREKGEVSRCLSVK